MSSLLMNSALTDEASSLPSLLQLRHRLERARSGIQKTKRTTVRNGGR